MEKEYISSTHSPDSDYDDIAIDRILAKYLMTSRSPSYSSSSSSCASSTMDDDCFSGGDDDNDNGGTTLPTVKYHIDVPPISISRLSESSLLGSSASASIISSGSSVLNSTSSSVLHSETSYGPELHATLPPLLFSSTTIETPIVAATQGSVHFDLCGGDGKYSVSSNGIQSGYQEWTIKILKCDAQRQEIGIVSSLDTDIDIGNYGGIRENAELGARAVFGNISEINSFYYAVYDNGNECQCYKHVPCCYWAKNDEIKLRLDLAKGTMTFLLNNKDVAKAVGIDKNHKYYPFISFAGNCKYKVIG